MNALEYIAATVEPATVVALDDVVKAARSVLGDQCVVDTRRPGIIQENTLDLRIGIMNARSKLIANVDLEEGNHGLVTIVGVPHDIYSARYVGIQTDWAIMRSPARVFRTLKAGVANLPVARSFNHSGDLNRGSLVSWILAVLEHGQSTRVTATVEPSGGQGFPELLHRLQAARLVPRKPTHQGSGRTEYTNFVVPGPAGYGYRSTYVEYKEVESLGQILQFCLFDHPVTVVTAPVDLRIVPAITKILTAIGNRSAEDLSAGIRALKSCSFSGQSAPWQSLDPVRSAKVLQSLPADVVAEVHSRYP